MGPWLLAAVALAYLWVAAEYIINKQIGMGFAFIAYALANVGFIIDILWR